MKTTSFNKTVLLTDKHVKELYSVEISPYITIHNHRYDNHKSYNNKCTVSSCDRQVSWVRRKHGEDDLQLLTVGLHTYSGDSRYTVEFQYPNNWRLQIKFTNKRDEGTYECQLSTHPPKVIQIHLHINGE
jgi:hypothetical protein